MPTGLEIQSSEVVAVSSPVAAPAFTVAPIDVVAVSVPSPTLVDGRPQ